MGGKRERGVMILISGPSGCGKSTICRRLLEDPAVVFSVSATTRAAREGEVDGREYHFLSPEEFRRRVGRGEFLEWAEVHGNLYGTQRSSMEEAIAAGRHFLVEIDVQGALQLKGLGIPGVYIFIAPPSMEELERRLRSRGTDSPEVILRRLAKAHDEMLENHKYDHVIENHELDAAIAQVRRVAGLSEASTTGGGRP